MLYNRSKSFSIQRARMKTTVRRYIATGCTLFLLIGSALADDVLPPAYRGQAGSTFQLWNFATGVTNPPADSVNNPIGTPTLTVVQSINNSGIGWQDSQSVVYGSKQGFWDLGNDGHMDLAIPTPAGGSNELLRLQITYFQAIDKPPLLTLFPTAVETMATNILDQTTTLGAWYTEVLDWTITPEPTNNLISIFGDPTSGSVIDQVIVDTMAVPEPSTISLGGLALLGAAWEWQRRRKR